MHSSIKLGSYAQSTLSPTEIPLLRARYHPIRVIIPFCVGLPFILIASGLILAGISSRDSFALTMSGFLMFGFFGLTCYLFPFLRFVGDEIVVTDKRVIIKTGVLARDTRELFLQKIESVDLRQGILSRMLNCGTIIIRGTGGTAQAYRFIRDPLRFRATVQRQELGE